MYSNTFDEQSDFAPVEVEIVVSELLDYYGVTSVKNLYEDILELDVSIPN